MTLARQFLLLQVLVVLLVLLAVGAISIAQAARTFERQELRPARSAAENLAANPFVRQRLGGAEPGEGSGLSSVAESVRTVSGSSGVLLTDTARTVLVSSDPTLVGRRVALGSTRVLRGASWTGTQEQDGSTVVVAQVPVYDLRGEVVGVASVQRDVPSVWTRLGDVAPNLLVYLGVASVLGLGGSLLLSRRVKRQTLGMEPTEIAGLVEHREALVHGVKEGVLALDREGRVTVVNDSARELLGLPHDALGSPLEQLALDAGVVEVLTGERPGPDRLVLVDDRVLALNRRPLRSHGTVIGSVTTLRDRTELSALERELGTTRATSNTLRAQTHEFANQLHTISGLLQLGEHEEVVRFVDGVRLNRTALYDEVTSRVADATVAALLIAKASLAGERGVDLRLDPGSRLPKVYGTLSRDLATVVGNLVDNALDAAGDTPADRSPRVRVLVEGHDDRVVVEVADTGPGAPTGDEVFRQGWSTKSEPGDEGRGFGLALVRLVCRRRGGEVALRNDDGAVFTATLPLTAEEQAAGPGVRSPGPAARGGHEVAP
ncbi:MAG: signal transduction histidine kinase regulating citrate/malate metabolism [Marmoricola sp.]|nr:signal transduction histidine kinase regulating citrate/malate metabolism [Marmoricola sp.]